MRNSSWIGFSVGSLFLMLIFPVLAPAQTAATGALTGRVTDASGAAIAAVEVKVTNEATGAIRSVASAADGSYTVPLLPPGSYVAEFSKPGFQNSKFEHVRIAVTEVTALNVKLAIGTVTQTVTVEAHAEILQTQSSALGQVTSGRQIRNLPLVTRNYTQIVSLNPGVSADVNDAGVIGNGSRGSDGAPIVSNGVSENDNNFQMNGVEINDLQGSGNFSGGVAIPNPDTIQEFKVQTGQYDAAYGRNAGANVDVITKGGSNDFHGAAWEFFRNEDLNADNFFRNQLGLPRPVLKQNQFGGDLGGPIRKDKLFFFASYQGTRQRNGLDVNCSSRVTTPPFTNDRSPAALGTLFAGQTGFFGPGVGGKNTVKADGSNINPVALKLLQFKLPNGQFLVPTPQSIDPSQPFAAQGISEFSLACPFTDNQFMANGDWQMSAKSKLEERFFFSNSYDVDTLPESNFGGGTVPGSASKLTNNYRNFTLKHTYVFSPAVVNEATIGFHRTFGFFNPSNAFSYSQIGATVPAFDTLPVIYTDVFNPTGLSLGGNGQRVLLAQNTYNVLDSLSWIKGRHSLRFGGGLTREQLNYGDNIALFALQEYLSFPDFLLGLGSAGNGTPFSNVFVSVDAPGNFGRAYRVWEANAYAQDDIKLTSRLTVNLGLRYDRLGDLADAKGRNAGFDTSLANPNPPPGGTLAGTTVPANFSGGAIPAGVTQLDNNYGIRGDGQNTVNPRVGFAWMLPRTERFVLRGGYGIYRSRSTGQPLVGQLFAPPFGTERVGVGFTNAAATNQVPFSLNVPTFPAFLPYSPATSNAIFVFAPNFRPPMIQEYSLGVQTALTKTLVLETAYSGMRGLHLIRTRSLNQAQLASPANPIRGVTTNTFANVPLRVPFEGFASGSLQNVESAGAAWYNALLVSLNKRFSHGLQLQAAYTFAKELSTDAFSTIGSNGGEAIGDQNNPKSRYGPDLFIRAHRLIVNYVYELPSPRNRTAFLGQLLGGWAVAGITTVQSGEHLTPFFDNSTNVFGISNDRPSLSGACTPGQLVAGGPVSSHLNNYINASCFALPALYNPAVDPLTRVFGNAGIGIFDGPGQNNWDIALIKQFPFNWPKEGTRLEFRTEFFNTFNHTQFANPNTQFGSATFGQIAGTAVAPRIMQFALKLNF